MFLWLRGRSRSLVSSSSQQVFLSSRHVELQQQEAFFSVSLFVRLLPVCYDRKPLSDLSLSVQTAFRTSDCHRPPVLLSSFLSSFKSFYLVAACSRCGHSLTSFDLGVFHLSQVGQWEGFFCSRSCRWTVTANHWSQKNGLVKDLNSPLYFALYPNVSCSDQTQMSLQNKAWLKFSLGENPATFWPRMFLHVSCQVRQKKIAANDEFMRIHRVEGIGPSHAWLGSTFSLCILQNNCEV